MRDLPQIYDKGEKVEEWLKIFKEKNTINSYPFCLVFMLYSLKSKV